MSNEANQEKRGHERIPFREDILVDGISACSSMDISEGGLFISTIQTHEANSVINVIIPFNGEKLKFKAQVRYCEPGIGMGIMFIDLDEGQRKIIKKLLKKA
jgi:hypothetical protein